MARHTTSAEYLNTTTLDNDNTTEMSESGVSFTAPVIDVSKLGSAKNVGNVVSKRETKARRTNRGSRNDKGDDDAHAPRKKRARVASSGPLAGRRKQTPSQAILSTLPLEVLYRICALADPADLIALAKTCSGFWHTLRTPGAEPVWRNTREGWEVVQTPAPPREVSELHWAVLLFGEPICYTCKNKAQDIAYSLLRRACASCRKKNLVYSGRWARALPDYDDAWMDLIPYTTVGGWNHSRGSHESRYFWLPDVHAFAQNALSLEKDVHIHKSNAKMALKNFKEEHRNRAAELNLIDKEMRNWEIEKDKFEQEVAREHRKLALNRFALDLIKDGYEQTDVDEAVEYHSRYNTEKLTAIGWKKLRPSFVETTEKYRGSRIVAQRKAQFDKMLPRIERRYTTLMRALDPQMWRGQPPASALLSLAPLTAAVDAICSDSNLDEEKEDEALETAFTLMPAALAQWANAREAALTRAVDEGVTNKVFPSAAALFSVAMVTTTSEAGFRWQYRPTKFSSTIMTPEDVRELHPSMFYHAWDDDATNIYFKLIPASKRATQTLGNILKVTGANSCAELDQRNVRTVCLICPLERDKDGLIGRPVRTWRQALEHVEQKYCAQHCQVLSDEQAADARAHETLKYDFKSWACAHCDEHFSLQATYLEVIAHLKQRHNNDSPIQSKDFFWYDSGGDTIRCLHDASIQVANIPKAVKGRVPCTSHIEEIPLSTMVVYCLWCPTKTSYGPGLDDIGEHILASHKIAKAHQQPNIDYGTENHPEVKNPPTFEPVDSR